MSAMMLVEAANVATVMAADSGDLTWIPPGSALAVLVLVYGGIYRYYRNTDKRHAFEHETHVEVSSMQAYDHRTGTTKGTRERSIRGRNSENHLARVGPVTRR